MPIPPEYALANRIDDPKNIYVREDLIVTELDRWLASLFDANNLDVTLTQLLATGGPTPSDFARVEAAQRRLAECDEKLGRYRSALEAGADASVVAGWIAEVEAERAEAQQAMSSASGSADYLSAEEITSLVGRLGDVAARLERTPRRRRRCMRPSG